MLLGNLRAAAAAALALVFLTAGLGSVAWVVAEDSNSAVNHGQNAVTRPAFVEQPGRISNSFKDLSETWTLTLPEAIRIGLNNSLVVRVISLGANGTPCQIAPLKSAVDAERFRSDVMAAVRSIEQQYWLLGQAHAQLGASEKSAQLAEEILSREKAEVAVGKGAVADVAEPSQRLEQLNLDLATRRSDLITTERQLRSLLGLPPDDGRRIVPVTAPTEARLEPDWDDSLAAMLENHPDVVRAKVRVNAAEDKMVGDGPARLERQKANLQQVVHQTTHSLARFFLEIDANYKQFKTASRLRAAAAERLNAQRAFYEEGRITIDRFLDAVSQYATAVATEAQYKALYNISIVALEEAKGTLLEYDKITVVEGLKSGAPADAVRDGAAKPGSREPPALIPAPPPAAPKATSPLRAPVPAAILPASRPTTSVTHANDASLSADLGGKTFSFRVTVGIGSKPVEISGSFTITPVRSADASKVP